MTETKKVPVLIIGGGGAGLTASMLFSKLGIETMLVSSLPTTSILPKAHVLNQRAMEIMGDCGIADEIYETGTPAENMRATGFYTGFAGPSEDHGRLIKKMECWGAGYSDMDWMRASPRAQTNLPQIRLEPILKRHAEELAPGTIHFNHEVTALEQDDSGSTVTVLNKDTNEEYAVRADWVLACDGGRTVGSLVGIELEGERGLQNIVTHHISADLSKWARDPDTLIRWIFVPDIGLMAVLVPMGPDHWGPESEEWVVHLNYATQDSRGLDDEQVTKDMRAALGVGDHPMTVHKISRWTIEGVLASQFRKDRVFVVGDAAHRHPPAGGLGLTSAMHDTQNLTWKLAAVIKGQAGEEILDSYEQERRPVDARNVQRSLENIFGHMSIAAALGITAEASAEENWANVRRLWDDDPNHDALRREVRNTVAAQSMEFREQVVEYGYTYESSAVVPDGSEQVETPDDIRVYIPTTRPGNPLPHAQIETDDGELLSTIDLVRPGRFLLIAGENGRAWCDAASEVAEANGIPLETVTIGHADGDILDPFCQWIRHREFNADGAILVRPDRFVAWRALGAAEAPAAVLKDAFAQVLHRDVA